MDVGPVATGLTRSGAKRGSTGGDRPSIAYDIFSAETGRHCHRDRGHLHLFYGVLAPSVIGLRDW